MIERSVFLAALEIDEESARLAYLDEACRDDPALRRRVDELLAAHLEARTFMEGPAAGTTFEATPDPTGPIPHRPNRSPERPD